METDPPLEENLGKGTGCSATTSSMFYCNQNPLVMWRRDGTGHKAYHVWLWTTCSQTRTQRQMGGHPMMLRWREVERGGVHFSEGKGTIGSGAPDDLRGSGMSGANLTRPPVDVVRGKQRCPLSIGRREEKAQNTVTDQRHRWDLGR